jgi:hypothetical protein
MNLRSSCILLAVTALTGGPIQEEEPSGPYEIQKKILDSFGDFQFLVSVGSKDGVRKVVQSFTPNPPAHSVTWQPTIDDTTSKYFFIRIWNAGGGDAPKGDPEKPVAWLAPVWTGR